MECNLSVAMATFNGEKHVVEQLESLARQTLLPVELIVTDDGSTDKTVDLIMGFADQLKFPLQVFQNDVRLGYGRNFLKAASLTKSKYVAFCDQDDIWHPEKIALVNEVASRAEHDLIVHGGKVVDVLLNELGESFPKVVEGVIELDKYSKMFFPGYAMTVKRDFLKKIDYESHINDQDKNFEHDLWICTSILQAGSCFGINKPLVSYRQHDSNVIGFSALMSSERHMTIEKHIVF